MYRKIKDAAQQSGLSVKTVRYYEECRLLQVCREANTQIPVFLAPVNLPTSAEGSAEYDRITLIRLAYPAVSFVASSVNCTTFTGNGSKKDNCRTLRKCHAQNVSPARTGR